jgi:hypothetical protein
MIFRGIAGGNVVAAVLAATHPDIARPRDIATVLFVQINSLFPTADYSHKWPAPK